jgi:hypothetical protein
MSGVALTIWFLVVAVWAVRPQTDAVPVGTDYSQSPPRLVSVEVECNSLFDGSAGPDGPLPVLTPQPALTPPVPELAFQRAPCELVRTNARILLAIDVVFYVLVMAAGITLLARRRGTIEPVPFAQASV